MFGCALLPRGAFHFLAFVFAESRCISHEFLIVICNLGNYSISKLPNVVHAFSSCAYFSTNFFNPNRGNCTVSLASSPSPSRWKTVPSPYFGCFTFCPGRKPRWPLGSSTGTFGMLNFLPREAKNSAMLSMELYRGPELGLAGAGSFQAAD